LAFQHYRLLIGLTAFFSALNAQTTSGLEVDGWAIVGKIAIYSPKTLADYIGDAAELYLNYDFRKLTVAEYQNAESATVVVEIYRHDSPRSAFGIYSQECSVKGNWISIGVQGYFGKQNLNFLTGDCYIKLYSYDLGDQTAAVLETFARKIVGETNGMETFPAELNLLPMEGKLPNSEKYFARNFLGFDFLTNGFAVEYFDQNRRFQVFVIVSDDTTAAREMMTNYFALCEMPSVEPLDGRYTLLDPYHGEMIVIRKGRYLWGVLNCSENTIRGKYLGLVAQRIDSQDRKD